MSGPSLPMSDGGVGPSALWPSVSTHSQDVLFKHQKKEERRMRRRMQLAAALIEADNELIQHRLMLLSQQNEMPPEYHDSVMLPKYATESALFRDSQSSDSIRPVYTYPLASVQELSRNFVGLSAKWDEDELSDYVSASDNQKNGDAVKLDLHPNTFGSPMIDVLHHANMTMENGQEPEPSLSLSNESEKATLKTSHSMPQLSDPGLDSRADFLLHRIQQMKEHPESTPNLDVSMSSNEDSSMSRSMEKSSDILNVAMASYAGSNEDAQINALGIELGSDNRDLPSFRQRVLKRQNSVRRPSGRRHSLSVSGWPGEMHSVADEAGILYGQALPDIHSPATARDSEQTEGEYQLHAPFHSENDYPVSTRWSHRLNPFKTATKKRFTLPSVHTSISPSGESSTYPHLAGLSPVPDEVNVTHSIPSTKDDDMIGVSLHSPLPTDPVSERAPSSATTIRPSQLFEHVPVTPDLAVAPGMSHTSASFYVTDEGVGTQRRSAIPSYICIPMPLSSLSIDYRSLDNFFTPHGSFVLDGGVIVPSIKNDVGTFAPVEIPAHLGRRALHPSTALFRNVLVNRDEDREGWGWEHFTNASKYFADLAADDDDSDDELPLMDVRIHKRDEVLAEKRCRRERLRRKREKRERQRLHALAKNKRFLATKHGSSPISDDETFLNAADEDIDDDDTIIDDESDGEIPWNDDRRPAGRLYGTNLIDKATRHELDRQQAAKHYGHHSAINDHIFNDDTRERMQRLFGQQTLWEDEKRRYETPKNDQHATMDAVMEPGIASAIVYPTSEEIRELEDTQEVHDDDKADAWLDDSSDEDKGSHSTVPSTDKMSRTSRFELSQPQWIPKGDDDMPLISLQHVNDTPSSDEDLEPLGKMHPQAEIIAEKEAMLRRLQEENSQIRMMLLHSTMQMPPVPYMPWMMPPVPGSMTDTHSMLVGADAGDDVPAAYMYDPNIHAYGPSPLPERLSMENSQAATWNPNRDTLLLDS